MDRKSFLLEMRKAGQLKGLKPCFIVLKKNKGGISKADGQFILSQRDHILYFQKVSLLFGMLLPKADFKLDIRDYVCYKREDGKLKTSITFFKKDTSYFPFEYMTGTRETFSTEDNMNRILKELEALGIKKMELKNDAREDINSGTEESN